MEAKQKNSYIMLTSAMGGIGGALYGFRHPSEKSCMKISKLSPTVLDTMESYRDSFDLKKAKEALESNRLSEDEFNKLGSIVDNFSNVLDKEKIVREVQETPFAQRTVSYRKAVHDANMSRPKLYKALMALTKDFQDKLVELSIFNKQKFIQATHEAKKKTILMYKELSKGALKGLAVGISAGLAIGYLIKELAVRKKS